ncbi:MFS transporter, partial [Priestia megaterium]
IIYIPVGWMIALRLVHGFFMSVAMTMLGTLVAQIIPQNRRGEGIGYYGISLVVASAIGPFLGVMLISQFGFKSIFIMTILVSLAALFFAGLLKISSQKPVYSKEKLHIKQFIEPSALPIAILFTLVCIAYSSLIAFISNYSASLDLVNLGNFFFLIYGVTVLFSRPFAGKLFDNKGVNYVIYPALLLLTLGLFALSQSPTALWFVVGAILIGLGFGNFQSSSQTMAIQSVPQNRIGVATATYFVFMDLGYALGPVVLGILQDRIGYQHMYLLVAILVLLVLVTYYFIIGKSKSKIVATSK